MKYQPATICYDTKTQLKSEATRYVLWHVAKGLVYDYRSYKPQCLLFHLVNMSIVIQCNSIANATLFVCHLNSYGRKARLLPAHHTMHHYTRGLHRCHGFCCDICELWMLTSVMAYAHKCRNPKHDVYEVTHKMADKASFNANYKTNVICFV